MWQYMNDYKKVRAAEASRVLSAVLSWLAQICKFTVLLWLLTAINVCCAEFKACNIFTKVANMCSCSGCIHNEGFAPLPTFLLLPLSSV